MSHTEHPLFDVIFVSFGVECIVDNPKYVLFRNLGRHLAVIGHHSTAVCAVSKQIVGDGIGVHQLHAVLGKGVAGGGKAEVRRQVHRLTELAQIVAKIADDALAVLLLKMEMQAAVLADVLVYDAPGFGDDWDVGGEARLEGVPNLLAAEREHRAGKVGTVDVAEVGTTEVEGEHPHVMHNACSAFGDVRTLPLAEEVRVYHGVVGIGTRNANSIKWICFKFDAFPLSMID